MNLAKCLHKNYVTNRIENSKVTNSDNSLLQSSYFKELNRSQIMQPFLLNFFLSLLSRPNADIAVFFKFENQQESPTLSDNGMFCSGQKSDIISCVLLIVDQ